MNVIKYTLVILLLLNLLACGKKNDQEIDISKIEAVTELIRFDQRFYTAAPEELGELKTEFPYLFPEPNPDSVWTAKMKDDISTQYALLTIIIEVSTRQP